MIRSFKGIVVASPGTSLASRTGLIIGSLLAVVMLIGCGGRSPSSESVENDKVVAQQLQKSFDQATETIKQQTAQAAEALIAKDYERAVEAMCQVIRSQRTLDPAQKQAVDNLLLHIRKKAENNPSLDTPKLYKAVKNLHLLLHPMD